MTRKGAAAAKTATLKRRIFTREFKLQVIREVEAGKTQAQVARDYQLSDNTISKSARSCANIRSARLPVAVTPTPMKRASTNWNAWWAGSPWRTTF